VLSIAAYLFISLGFDNLNARIVRLISASLRRSGKIPPRIAAPPQKSGEENPAAFRTTELD